MAALSALRAHLGVGSSRMIVNAAVGRTTGSASSFSRTLKVVSGNANIGVGVGVFSKIRRFSDVAGLRLPEKITSNTALFGQYYFALYLGGLLGASAILC